VQFGTLRELKLGARTLVVFSSDNGPWLTQGKDGGEAGPLRGGKGSTFEGGVPEPTIAWWPGKIAPGSTCDAIAGNIDLLPTFVSLAGGHVPAVRKTDGRDISPLLFGESKESPREVHYYYRGYKLEAVRCGPWKLALGPQVEAVPREKGKAGGLIDRQPMKDFCVGHDNRVPLDSYDGKTRFAGAIEKLKVVTGNHP